MDETNKSMASATQVSVKRVALSLVRSQQVTDIRPATDDATSTFFDREIPGFLAQELERLYQSVYSTAVRLRIYGKDKDASAYVARRGGKVISVILFRLEGNKVVVLNQQTSINALEITRFSQGIFSRYKAVNLISFWGLLPTAGKIPYANRRNYCLPEVVVTLPESADAYLSSLGKSTRRSVRSSLKKVTAAFPSFCVETRTKGEIGPSEIFDIVKLNNARMAIKEKVSYNSDEETQRLIRLANVYGLVLALKIDGRICAGALGYRVGSTCFFHTLAHDPRFDEFKLGTVCCYLMMSECIARGVHEVRFGGSSHRYKFDFRGNLLQLHSLTIYRNIGHYILYAASAFPTSFVAYIEKAKLWLLFAERREDIASRVIARGLSWLRQYRRIGIAQNDNTA